MIKLLKPSSIPSTGTILTIKTATQESFTKYQSTETENLVYLTFEEIESGYKVIADNFVALAKQYNTWNYAEWPNNKIRLYSESKEINGINILMVRVGEKLTRKANKKSDVAEPEKA